MNNEYDQPAKRQVRNAVLEHAVRSLTADRSNAPVSTADVIAETIDYCCNYIERVVGYSPRREVDDELKQWWPIYHANVGRKRPEDLHVLILSGPKPSNDASILAGLGVPAQNIWAVENDNSLFEEARRDIRESGLAVKLHYGSLQEFFTIVPQRFDIVYFDACGPLFGGRPATWPVLRELFVNQRLTPLCALITTFCSAVSDPNTADLWVRRMACWFAPRYDEPIEFSEMVGERVVSHRTKSGANPYFDHIASNLRDYYSEFVTRFISESAAKLIPWWRLLALPATRKQLFVEGNALDSAVRASTEVSGDWNPFEGTGSIGHANLAPDAYSYLWTTKLIGELLPPNDPFRLAFEQDTILKEKFGHAISVMSLARNYFESVAGWADHNRDGCSEALQRILDDFRWFDSPGAPADRMFCDVPLPHLLADLIVGQLGYPHHLNVARLKRFEHTARSNRMLSDVFIFDQARYLYDAAPSLPTFDVEMPFGRQIILRTCMDSIWRHTRSSCPELFWACSLAGLGEGGFKFHAWTDRKRVEL